MNNHWVIGKHAVTAFLAVSPERVLTAFAVEPQGSLPKEIGDTLAQHSIRVTQLDKRALSEKVESDRHQGIALEVKPRQTENEQALFARISSEQEKTDWLFLILDQVKDPHNLGACLRTAAAAGADAVIIPKDNAAPLNATVRKVASGAAEIIPVYAVTNLRRTLQGLKDAGIWLLGTSDRAKTGLYQQDLTGNVALILGAEDVGLRRITEAECDVMLRLPMSESVVSSLNVSVAAGVCLYEALRQRVES
ncbi:MAG: 23S rRNA (guanosine(2251)-2'-O)-methyltransferase RlmB [Pseudomonadota bacterium]